MIMFGISICGHFWLFSHMWMSQVPYFVLSLWNIVHLLIIENTDIHSFILDNGSVRKMKYLEINIEKGWNCFFPREGLLYLEFISSYIFGVKTSFYKMVMMVHEIWFVFLTHSSLIKLKTDTFKSTH